MGIQLCFREKGPEYFVLDFDTFRTELIRELKEVCGPEYSIEKRDVMKNNGVMLSGVSVMGLDETVAPTIYLEALYECYKRGDIDIGEAVNEILRIYSRERKNADFNMFYLSDFDEVKGKIIFRLINADKNADFLSTVPHRRILDLAVIYTVFIDGVFPAAGNVTVRHDLMREWGTDEEELFRLALENTPRIKEPVIKELSDMIFELIEENTADPAVNKELPGDAGLRMLVITNSDRFYGDSIILYPGLLRELKKSLKSDLFLLPSSVHEFIIVPDNGEIRGDELAELVRSVNTTAVGAEEFLSDNVYTFKDDEIRLFS